MEKNRVMFIVLDGAGFDVLFSLAQKNVLPNIKKIYDRGLFNPLISTKPPLSPVAMPSLFSGKNPGKHGMFGFGRIEKGVFKPFLSLHLPGNTLWDILGNYDKKVILLNVPWTYPPFQVNGIMVSGPPLPGNRAKSYPPELISILESKIGRYLPDLNIEGYNYGGLDEKRFIKEAYFVTKKRAEALVYLMENYEWDLFLSVFTTFDRMQHVYFGYFYEKSPLFDAEKSTYLIDYFKKIDDIIGDVASLLDENDYLIIASDHGFEHIYKSVGINNLLVQGGFAKKRSNTQFLTVENIANFISKMGITKIKNRFPKKIVSSANRLVPKDLDYARSRAIGVPGGYISINKKLLKNIQEYEKVKKELVCFFNSVKDDESGEKVVERIYDPREIYQGDYVKYAPDLFITFKTGYEPSLWKKSTLEPVKRIMSGTTKTGSHFGPIAQRGIFLLSGKGISEKVSTEANIVDVTPTILHILGIPIPRDIDGKVVEEVFQLKSEFLHKAVLHEDHPLGEKKISDGLSKKDEEEILKKLKKLGYI